MRLRRLPIAELYKLNQLVRTAGNPAWVAEVEQFVFGGELTEFAKTYGSQLAIEIVEEAGAVRAVAVSYPDPVFLAVRIGALLVDSRFRRKGLGLALLQRVVNGIIERGGVACWLVHPDNQAMRRCSRLIVPTPDEGTVADGYILFVTP